MEEYSLVVVHVFFKKKDAWVPFIFGRKSGEILARLPGSLKWKWRQEKTQPSNA
jgi:hypothetical protein